MSREEMKNRIKFEQMTAMMRSLLRQGFITEEIFIKTDRLNRLSCGVK